jgi:hypothetical protein
MNGCNPLRPTTAPAKPELDLAKVLGIIAFALLFLIAAMTGV